MVHLLRILLVPLVQAVFAVTGAVSAGDAGDLNPAASRLSYEAAETRHTWVEPALSAAVRRDGHSIQLDDDGLCVFLAHDRPARVRLRCRSATASDTPACITVFVYDDYTDDDFAIHHTNLREISLQSTYGNLYMI